MVLITQRSFTLDISSVAFHVNHRANPFLSKWQELFPIIFPNLGHFTITHQRRFQLKISLFSLIQIPCHHMLANEIALNSKQRIGLKHFFNINLGIGIIKKTTFFCLYFRHISPCFYSNFDRESSNFDGGKFWRAQISNFDRKSSLD